VRDVGRSFNLYHCKDCRVVVASHRGVLDTEKPSETRSGNGEPFPIPELERELFESKADDISVSEGEGVITAIVMPNPHKRLGSVVLPNAERAGAHRRQLVPAPEEDGKAIARGAGGEAHSWVPQLLVQNAAQPRHRVVARGLHRDQAGQRVGVTHRRAVHVDAGGAAVNHRLHLVARGGTQAG
jgi:hypothetical protein